MLTIQQTVYLEFYILYGCDVLRKKLLLTIMMLVLILWNSIPVYALQTEQSTAIQSFLDDARRVSRSPGMAVAITVKEETHFFSTGVANREAGIFADDKTLWELASIEGTDEDVLSFSRSL